MTVNPLDADRPPEQPRSEQRGQGDVRRRRRDESLMVPEARFESYYGRQVVKPAPWKSEIPTYLFLGGVAGGSGLIGAGGAAMGYPALRRIGRFTALGAASLGGIALAKDLGKPSRALNMLRTVKLTSPMSVGSWILTAFSGFAGLAAAAELGRSMLDHDSFAAKVLRVAEPPATIGSALFSAPLAAYTAVLLSDTASPTWHESYRELPFVFVSSANAAAAGWALVTAPSAQNGPARRLAAMSAALEVAASERMQHTVGETLAEPLRGGRAGALLKASRFLTIGGATGAVLFGRYRPAAVLSGLALLAGSACTRFGVVEAGVESAKDPRYTIQPQKERLEQRRSRGATADSITTSRSADVPALQEGVR